MPFTQEIVSLQERGFGSLQNDTFVQDPFSRGCARSDPGGKPENHVVATPQEIYDYCKVRDYPGEIYPHGVFFLIEDGPSQKILACSANCAQFFGASPEEVLGSKFPGLFEDGSKIAAALSSDNIMAANPITLCTAKGPKPGELAPMVNVILQRSPNGIIADVEELDPCEDFLAVNDSVRSAVGMLETCATPQELCQQMVWDAFNILGCDRMCVWHSHEDGNLEVTAERRSKRVNNPFLGTMWPAVDFDPTSRLGYLQRPYARQVVDASADGVKLLSCADHIGTNEISLKLSSLRVVHKSLPEQMAVWGSKHMSSWALVYQGRFWGLLCAHHATAKNYSFQTRMAIQLLAQGFNQRLSKMLDGATLAAQENQFKLSTLLCARAQEKGGANKVESFLDGSATIANTLEGCKAAAVFHKGAWTKVGEVPAEELLNKLVDKCKAEFPDETPQPIVQLSALVPDLASASPKSAGALYIPIPGHAGSCLLMFRPELSKSTTWAGDPDAAAIKDRETGIIWPRKSYSDVQKKNTGRCVPWLKADVEAGIALGRVLAAAVSDKLTATTEIDAATYPAFSVDGAGNVAAWNAAVAKLSGIDAAAAVGKPASSFLLPKSQEALQMMLVQAVQGVMSGGGELVLAIAGARAPEEQGHLAVRAVPLSTGTGVTFLGLDRRATVAAELKYKRYVTVLSQIDRTGASLRPNNMVVNVQATEDKFEYFPDKEDSAEALILEDKVGKVYLMVNRNDGSLYEVRKINVKKAEKVGATLTDMKRDLVPLLRLVHPGVVRCRACFTSSENKNLNVVNDYEGDKLALLLHSYPTGLAEATCASIAKQLLKTLADLHARNITHGNLTSMSVVIMEDGTTKVSDLGLKCLLKTQGAQDKEDVLAAGKVLMAALGEGGKGSALAGKIAPLLSADPTARPSAADACASLA
mmetsp:Transcript_58918/g.138535  ORF Transcript_58918/g.138535 Transcript_58918/m.138535 type:complete len:927 (+) Transcript_58918:74-2854(+)